MCAVTRTGFTVDERLARLGEQVPDDERRVAHHVVEHAAALQLAAARTRACADRCAPRPRARGTAARSSPRRAPRAVRARSRPAARRPGSRGSRAAARRASRARAPRFASATLRASGFSQAMPLSVPLPRSIACDDLLDVLDARVVRAGEPDRVDRRIGDHVGDRRIRLRLADVELARELRRPTPRSSCSDSRRRGRRRRARLRNACM